MIWNVDQAKLNQDQLMEIGTTATQLRTKYQLRSEELAAAEHQEENSEAHEEVKVPAKLNRTHTRRVDFD